MGGTTFGQSEWMMLYTKLLIVIALILVWILFALFVEPPAEQRWEYGLEMTEIPKDYEQYTIRYEPVFVPTNSGAIAYQYSSSITKTGSPQITLQNLATPDSLGYTKIGDYYLIAMGKYYGSVGDKLRITTEVSGETLQFKVILGDVKASIHTKGGKGIVGLDGSILEFIVDKTVFVHPNIEQFRGVITNIEREV